MADTSRADFLLARQCWPERGREDLIPAAARSIYEAWQAASPDARRLALDAAMASGLTRAPGKDTERAQCRDLTLFGSPLPGPRSALRPLTTEQVHALGIVPPSSARPRRSTLAAESGGSQARSLSEPPPKRQGRGQRRVHEGSETIPRSKDDPSSADGGGSPDKRIRGGRESPSRSRSPARSESSEHRPIDNAPPATDRRVAELERILAVQEERIKQLFAQQLAEPHEDVSSAYVVLDEVWQRLGKHPTEDKCSWLNIPALKLREISEIVRTQSGTYPHFPCELDVVGGMKKLPGVKDAQISLLDFAQAEVTKFMRANSRTVRLSGTAYSRSLEMQHDLASFIEGDPEVREIPVEWVMEFVDKIVGTTRGTFVASIDAQTTLRLSVSHRLEKAMKVDHLTTINPLKAEREDFIPPNAMKRIEDAAKRNLDLSWALDQALGKASFSGRRPENSSRGGKADYARQRSRGGGTSKSGAPKGSKGGGGKGGKGRGRGSGATPRTETRADPVSPE